MSVTKYIKTQREQLPSLRAAIRQKVKGAIAQEASCKAYIRHCETYLRNGDWCDDRYGEHMEKRVKWVTIVPFIQDIAFLSEAIKATIYRDRGFTHPFQNLIELISNVSYDEETKKTHVGMDMELIRELSEDFTEDDGPDKA